MLTLRQRLVAVTGLAALAVAISGLPVPVSAANAVESLYADLAKLSPADRMAKIIEGAKKEEKLVAIPVFRGKLANDHTKIFRKSYPWVNLEAQDMNTEEARERFVAEETAGRHLTDSVGVTMVDLDPLLTRGLLAEYPTPATDAILLRYKGFLDDKSRWVPWTWSEHGVSYNSQLVKKADEPKSYMDLCSPRFKGVVSYDPGEPKWLAGMYMMMGEETYTKWLECIGKNEPVIQKGHTVRVTLMLAGDHAIQGDNFLYRGMMMKTKNPKKAPFEIAWDVPVMGRASIAATNKNTAHPYGAALWSDWQLSEESQKYVFDVFRGPLTMQHPFITDDTELFIYGIVEEDILNKASEIWTAKVGRR